MREAFAQVRKFHQAMNQPVGARPAFPDGEAIALRVRLINEEVGETLAAIRDADLVATADGIADAIYVLVGTAVAFGIPLPEVWEEISRSNMTKADGPVLPGGKRGKGPSYRAPDVAGALRAAGWEESAETVRAR